MLRRLLALASLAAVLASASPTRAEVPSRCRELFIESRFEAAQTCFDDALDEAQGTATTVADLFAYRAAALTARRRDDEARRAMEVVLALVPAWEATDPILTSPKITELLDAVRSSYSLPAGPVALVHEPSGPLEPDRTELVVEARVANLQDPLRAVVMVKRSADARFRALRLEGSGDRLSLGISLEPGERVLYYVAVLVPGGWAALWSGSPENPFVAERPAVGRRADGPGDRPGPGLGRRLWWVWTLVGVAAVGVGLGVGLAVAAGEETGSVRLRFP